MAESEYALALEAPDSLPMPVSAAGVGAAVVAGGCCFCCVGVGVLVVLWLRRAVAVRFWL